MHSLHHDHQSPPSAYHTLGLLHHGSIGHEVKTTINCTKIYTIHEILPSGQEKQVERLGKEILKNYADIFGNWLHGFIVIEKGGVSPIFIYTGPIAAKVLQIISSQAHS